MKRAKLIGCLAAPILGLTTSVLAEDALPATQPFSHYQPMVKRSPFAVATAAAAPAPGKPDFAKDLYVANAAHSPDGDFVTIASTTDKNIKEYLNTRDTIDGYSISSIQWSDRVGETKVTISKDGQFATLTFNEALLSQAIQNPVAQMPPPGQIPGRPQPGRPGPANAIQRPMPVPTLPTPAPHVRSTIRHRNNAQRTVPQPANVQVPQDDDSEVDDVPRP